MFENYTESARRSIFFARYEASQFGGRSIEVGHLLLGLSRESRWLFSQAATIDPAAALRPALEALCPRSADRVPTSADLPLSDSCARALLYADQEAERMRHRQISPEHLLLGVLVENGPEAQALGNLGINLEKTRSDVLRSLGSTGPV
jgi:ATP-dependent Clp protease ATP-binding subunit ClpC